MSCKRVVVSTRGRNATAFLRTGYYRKIREIMCVQYFFTVIRCEPGTRITIFYENRISLKADRPHPRDYPPMPY